MKLWKEIYVRVGDGFERFKREVISAEITDKRNATKVLKKV